MKKKKKKIIFSSVKKIFPIIIFIITIFMSIGYASINSIIIGYNGEVVAKAVNEVFITDINYSNDIDADMVKSKILSAYQTNLNSNIVLSNSNKDSSITYEISVYNSSNYDYQFLGVEYLVGDETYSNEDITFSTSINKEQIIKGKETLTFTITFNYLDNKLSVNNQLKSLLNFKFELVKYVLVSFDGNGGEVSSSSKELIVNRAYGELPMPVREGYNFSGWSTEVNGKEFITENSIVSIASDHTLYAQWNVKSYTVRFNANGGEGTMADQIIKYDAIVSLSQNAFTKTGYKFLGWALSSDGEKVYNDMENVVNLKLDGVVDLYALWVEDSYTVSFDYNGGSGSVNSMQVIYGEPYGVLPEYPYKQDHIFSGWYTSASGGTQVLSTSIVNTQGNHTLYAQWENTQYNDAIQNIVIKNVPDQDNDGIIDAIYLSFTCSSSFEKYNIPINNLVVGQKYKLSYTASNNASFGDLEAGYKNSMYGSIITKTAELSAGSIKTEAIADGGLIAEWSDRSKGDEWLNGPFELEMTFIAEASKMYWTWDFGLMQDGILYDFNITNIVLEPVVPEIDFSNKNLIVHTSSTAKVLNDVSDAYSSNFTFYGAGYAETLYYPITNLISGSTYTITFEHLYQGALIDDTSNTSNIRYEYGSGIMASAPTAFGSYMSSIGTYLSNTYVMKSVTGNVEKVTLTFTATSDKAYWVWNMANCRDSYNNFISIKVTNFSVTHASGGKITYYSVT